MVNFSAKTTTKLPKIIGILNITPDSFSDGGKFYQEESAINHLEKLLQEGADIIDIGAESTRPNSQILCAKEEIDRLKNILPKISRNVEEFNKANKKNIMLSIDTYHYETLVFAHQNGVNIANDVSGLIDKNIIKYIAKNNLMAVLMHNLSIHANPNIIINRELNVFEEICSWAKEKLQILEQENIKKSQIIFDPGIGFSKNAKQSLRIIKNIQSYQILGMKIMIGHSKKSFLDELKIPKKPNLNRDEKTLILSKYLAKKNVDYLRVHDVYGNIQAILNQ